MRNCFWIISLLLGTALYGQERKAHPLQGALFTLGVKGGVNFSDMHMEKRTANAPASYQRTRGAYLGVTGHTPLAPHWAFQPEVLLSIHGYRTEYSAILLPDAQNLLGYIQLPLLLQYVTTNGVVLQGGLQPGLLFHEYSEFKPLDLAWVAGAGYISRTGLGLEVRYTAGLINVAKKEDDYFSLSEAKNRMLQVGLVYVFNLRKRDREEGDVLTRLLTQ